MSQLYKLFEPTMIGNVEVKNRVVLPALGLGYTPDYRVNDRLKNFYVERAEGGVGLIIITVSRVQYRGRAIDLAIYDDKLIPGLRELTDLLHSRGTKVAAQLSARPLWVWKEGEPPEFVGPSDVIIRGRDGPHPRPLTAEEIGQIVEELGEQTRRAREAGFDAVEFAAQVGTSLLSQFISPCTNKRPDQYGGSLENRYRLLLEVIASAQKKAGRDYPLICRLSGADFMDGGYDLEDTKLAAPLLEEAGLSALDVTTGWHAAPVAFFQQGVPSGAYVYLAEEVKKTVNIPVMGGTKIDSPLLAEKLLMEGRVDLVFIGRAFIADSEFLTKAREGRLEDIRPCIACGRCFEAATAGEAVTCSVNARVGKEGEYTMEPSSRPRRVLVVGGGPAGLEAARVASLRGHKVHLYEKGGKLGGQLLVASLPPHKEEINNLTEYLVNQVQKAAVDVKLGSQATVDAIVEESPDTVIIATGALPFVPAIPGATGENVATAIEVLSGKAEVRERVIIVGGGMVGCETAEFLAKKDKRVTVLEMLDRIGNDIGRSTRWVILKRLKKAGVAMETKAEVEEITPTGVKVNRNGTSEFFAADSVVLAAGMKADTLLAETLKGKAGVLHVVGDCTQPRRIYHAIAEGFHAAWSI